MTDTHCLQCGSARVRRSRRRSPLEFAIAIAGWKVRRCHDCKARFFQFGDSLLRADGIKKLSNGLLFTALALAAVGIVICAILWFGHSQPPATTIDGLCVLPPVIASVRG